MLSDDKYIEMLTAGINRLLMPEAAVEWDADIGGRQFDVLATILAGLHRVLLAYEVRDKTRRLSVDAVDAFVTKLRDAKADKGVIVATGGFQKGCFTVAERHGIDLFQLRFVDDAEPKMPEHTYVLDRTTNTMSPGSVPVTVSEPHIAPALESVQLRYRSGKTAMVPGEASQMSYYLHKTKSSVGKTLLGLITPHVVYELEEGEERTIAVPCSATISPPDQFFFPPGELSGVELHMAGRKARMLSGSGRIEPSSFAMQVVYANAVTGDTFQCDIKTLPVGPAELKPGSFYFLYYPLRYYYCNDVTDGVMSLYLVESFQSGHLLRSIFTQKTKYARFYLPVLDKPTIKRLNARLERMKSRDW